MMDNQFSIAGQSIGSVAGMIAQKERGNTPYQEGFLTLDKVLAVQEELLERLITRLLPVCRPAPQRTTDRERPVLDGASQLVSRLMETVDRISMNNERISTILTTLDL